MKSRHSDVIAHLTVCETQLEECFAVYRKRLKALDINISAGLFALEFQNRASDILANISAILSPPRALWVRAPLSGIELGQSGEERANGTLTRLARLQNQRLLKASLPTESVSLEIPRTPESIPSIDTLLARTIAVTAEILSKNSIETPRIFAPSQNEITSMTSGSGEWLKSLETAPKHKLILELLLKYSVSPLDIASVTEKLDLSQMRKIPYQILYVRISTWIGSDQKMRMVTICVSDQIGEKTYIYHGYADLSSLSVAKKGESINWVTATGVRYSSSFTKGIERVIFDILAENLPAEVLMEESPNVLLETDNLSEILQYQSQLLAIEDKLREAGIVQEGGIWYFDNAKKIESWPKIVGKWLINFPSTTFNKKYYLGDKRWVFSNSTHLAELFNILWLRVATPEEYIAKYKRQILSIENELQTVGIVQKEGIWYFDNARGFPSWLKISGKSFRGFPSHTFNKTNAIGDSKGGLINLTHLEELFTTLWLRVATEEEYIAQYRNQILSIEDKFWEIGVVQEKEIWYFNDTKGSSYWPNIGDKNLQNFPSSTFNKTHHLGLIDGTLSSAVHLAELFTTLWLRVATEEEYIAQYRNQILAIEDKFWKAGIVQEDGVWYFDKAKGSGFWPMVAGKKLSSFPSMAFNRVHHLGTSDGALCSLTHLAQLFTILWLRVATEEEIIVRKSEQ